MFARYDRIASHYAAMWPLLVPGYVPILNAMLEIVRSMPSRPASLLDLGCGPGTATIAVAPASDPTGGVTLVDGSHGMLEEAKRLLGDHVRTTYTGDFTHTDLIRDCCQPEQYDLILCCFALHHASDQDKAAVIRYLGQALLRGGVLLLADEIASERPAGWPLVEQIRARIVEEHLAAGHISQEFWELETTLPTENHPPFRPARVDDLTSWMAAAGLATICPITVLGSALLVGVRPLDPTPQNVNHVPQ